MTFSEANEFTKGAARSRRDEIRVKLAQAQPITIVSYLFGVYFFLYGLAIIARPVTGSNTFLQQFIPLPPTVVGWFICAWAFALPMIGWLLASIKALAVSAIPVGFLMWVNAWQIGTTPTASLQHIPTGLMVFVLLLVVLWLLERVRSLETLVRQLQTTKPMVSVSAAQAVTTTSAPSPLVVNQTSASGINAA